MMTLELIGQLILAAELALTAAILSVSKARRETTTPARLLCLNAAEILVLLIAPLFQTQHTHAQTSIPIELPLRTFVHSELTPAVLRVSTSTHFMDHHRETILT